MNFRILLCLLLSAGSVDPTNSFKFLFPYIFMNTMNSIIFEDRQLEQMGTIDIHNHTGVCNYTFVDYIQYVDKQVCFPGDERIQQIARVNCIPNKITNNTIKIIENVQEVTELLKPVGNNTKRHEPGNCVLIYFYTPTSIVCTIWSRPLNLFVSYAHNIQIAAVDALKFRNFITEYGIVGLPTVILYHDGRPVVKFHNLTLLAYLEEYTGLELYSLSPGNPNGPLPLEPIQTRDPILWLAWIFIIFCMVNYFAKTRLCGQIIEMIERNWRESAARLEQT